MKSILIILYTLPFFGFSQVITNTWGVEDTIMVINKTTDYGPVHDYIELFNDSGEDLDMRWVCQEPNTWPALWVTNFTDAPQNNYYDVQDQDSADFLLESPPGFLNKMIIGVQHESYAHTDTVTFKVWPLNYPEDSLNLHYVIIITQGNAWASIDQSSIDFSYLVNGQNIQFSGALTADIKIHDLSGRLLIEQSGVDLNANPQLNVNTTGIVLVTLSTKEGLKETFKVSLF